MSNAADDFEWDEDGEGDGTRRCGDGVSPVVRCDDDVVDGVVFVCSSRMISISIRLTFSTSIATRLSRASFNLLKSTLHAKRPNSTCLRKSDATIHNAIVTFGGTSNNCARKSESTFGAA